MIWTKEGTGIKDAIDGLEYCTLAGDIVHWEQAKTLKAWQARFTAQSILGRDKKAVKDFLKETQKAINQAAIAGDARIHSVVCKEVIRSEDNTGLHSLSPEESPLWGPIGKEGSTHNVPTQDVATHDTATQNIPTHDFSTEDFPPLGASTQHYPGTKLPSKSHAEAAKPHN